jgi:hypothetical protein
MAHEETMDLLRSARPQFFQSSIFAVKRGRIFARLRVKVPALAWKN